MHYLKQTTHDYSPLLTLLHKRPFIQHFFNLGMVVCSALMIWRGLMAVTDSESPIVVVLSGSMEPGFSRGDLLLLTLYDSEPYKVGDVIVFKVEGREIPIVHRILRRHSGVGNDFFLLTKGDNNQVDDRGLYSQGQQWLERRHLMGRAKGFLPYVGMVTIIMNDYPYVKFLLIGFLGLMVLTNKE
eukprot:TRINITY_DN8556_c0_g1_i1.p1 TRINITY_DN8556_c0_g1~~TRINITY_DN8556_c0_g1_i1.p1  ORF type:complete len:185 (+),score=18.24 TRINITY_DN8556_c0_g1_i1:58-612(+)